MTINIFKKPSFFRFLSAIDSDLASRARLQFWNFCGGTLHRVSVHKFCKKLLRD